MAFGQPSGPPATRSQLHQLLELLEAAGHTDFRDARGPMGFTQRQAGGKFTRDEAEAFIEQLQAEAELHDGDPPAAEQVKASTPTPKRPAPPTAATTGRAELTPAEKQLRRIPTAELAAELQRRGWIVVEP
ncbi:MAG: hypothetical protein R2733_13865 [Acidimicrobiales bacterium]